MESIRPVVCREGIGAVVKRRDCRAGDAVGDSSDRFAKVGRIVAFVESLSGESLDDIRVVDDKGLEEGAERQEGECRVGHGDRLTNKQMNQSISVT